VPWLTGSAVSRAAAASPLRPGINPFPSQAHPHLLSALPLPLHLHLFLLFPFAPFAIFALKLLILSAILRPLRLSAFSFGFTLDPPRAVAPARLTAEPVSRCTQMVEGNGAGGI
jgi:hypothetical protein